MVSRPKSFEESIQATGDALRQDMRTINRSEELLVRARKVRQEIEARVRELLGQDRRRQRPRSS